MARPQFSAYACAKTALLRLVENVAEELKATNKKIIINAIAPGTIKSKMTEQVLQAGNERAGAKGFREAQETWNSGGTNPDLITNLLDFILDETLPLDFSGRLVHVKEPYREFIKNNPQSLPVDIGKLRRIGL